MAKDVEQVLMKLRSLLAKARANTVLDAMRTQLVGVNVFLHPQYRSAS